MKITYARLYLAFLIMTMLLCGCAKTVNVANVVEKDRVLMVGGNVYNNAGQIRVNTSKWILLFFDPASGTEVPLCTKVNCPHEGEGCDAYFPGVWFAMITGDKLYYLEDYNEFPGKNLCMADPNGTNRRVLYHLESTQYLMAAGAEDGYLFFSYYNYLDENGEALEKENCGLYLLDLETEKLEHIPMPENYQSRINRATIDQNALYYYYFTSSIDMKTKSYAEWSQTLNTPEGWEFLRKNTKLEIWKYELSSGNATCLLSQNGDQLDNLYLGYGYLFSRGINGKGHLENLSTGTGYALEAELINDMVPCLCDEGVVFPDIQNRQFLLWRYDTGKLETLGSYEDDVGVSVYSITRDWVYASLFTIPEPGANGEHIGEVYLSREQFMKGEYEWKPMPSYD